MGIARQLLRAPFTVGAVRELAFCLCGVVAGVLDFAVPGVVFGSAYGLATLTGAGRGSAVEPAVTPAALGGVAVALVAMALLAPPIGRALSALHRRLAARLLSIAVDPPTARRPGLRAILSDGPGWRGVAYSLLKLPLSIPQIYAVVCFVGGVVNLSYPLWWGLFRNPPEGVRLSPVPVVTPLGVFDVETYAGTFAAFAAGAAMLLVAPWVAHAAATLDGAVIRRLLAPGSMTQRVRHLEQSRTQVLDDAAATLRRLERDIHDGAQIRLATVALNLGMAAEKLGDSGQPRDLDQARELLALAASGAKDALADLRDLVHGIHPPVLDNGLPDALATLANTSVIPVSLRVDVPVRPAPAIETMAYFCTTELLANATKHSRASHVTVDLVGDGDRLRLHVCDDGVGGADPARGTGLSGLAQRISAADGHLSIASPAGGPTRISVDLPYQP
ncbi:MAG TPA: sensor domain-containing protein [Micromonosporaceae bacterium]